LTVASGFACWKPATHEVSALAWALDPEPFNVPETGAVVAVAMGAAAGASFAAHEERSMVPAMAIAAMLPARVSARRLKFTVFPFGDFLDYRMGPVPTRE
jgi:hypothetical protein